MTRPAVVVVARRTTRKNKYIDYVAEAHLKLLVRLKTLPVMVPVVEGARGLSARLQDRHVRSASGGR